LLGVVAASSFLAACSDGKSKSAPAGRDGQRPVAAAGVPDPTVPHSLVVRSTGWGRGIVIVTPDPGMACEDFDESADFMQICTGTVPAGTAAVAISMAPAPGATFQGWFTGPCAPSASPTCTVPTNLDQDIIAVFQLGGTPPPPVAPPTPLPPPPSVALTPAAATLDACRGIVFQASVPAATDPRILWSVQEPGGGTVTSGIYTAPSTAGTYHVVAQSQGSPSVQAVAAVTVNPDRVLSVAVTPGSVQSAPSGGVTFAATVTTNCGTFPAN
jgi:hypothetical protein